MEYIESEYQLSRILKNRVSQSKISAFAPLFYELEQKFDLTATDLCYMCYICPEILNKSFFSIINNVVMLSEKYNLKSSEVKYLLLKFPFLLTLHQKALRYKFKLISSIFGCSIKDSIKLVYVYPELLYLTKNFVLTQVKMICRVLDEYGSALSKIFRSEPRMLFITENKLLNTKKTLMSFYTLTEHEAQKVIKVSPTLCIENEYDLLQKYNFYYKNCFIKRDLKEILSKCPEFLTLDESVVENKIIELKKVFGIEKNKACDIIRIEPNILFLENATNKILDFSKLSISLKYIKSYPKICVLPEISLPIKFLIARILKLENRFHEICDLSSNLLFSRFLFMQTYGYFDHCDLLMSENEFYNKYHISNKVLLLNYKFEMKSLEKICDYYIKLKNKLPNWSNIVFPATAKIMNYSYGSNFFSSHKLTFGYYKHKDESFMSKLAFEAMNNLSKLELNLNEIKMIFSKNRMLINFVNVDFVKTIELLKKYGFTNEQIVLFLINKPTIFNYTIRELGSLINDICENEKCNEIEAIEKYLI